MSFQMHILTIVRAIQVSVTSLIMPLMLVACSGGSSPSSATLPPIDVAVIVPGNHADLGQFIFNDANLSEPHDTACISFHQPSSGFASNNGSLIGVALGSKPNSLGLRKPMTNSYIGFVPTFSFDITDGVTEAVGGQFGDGRADTLALQAEEPFLNPIEMNNGSRKAVVDKIAASNYAPLCKQEFGAGVFNDTDFAYTQIGVAFEAFERTKLQPFSSKFDAVVRGQATFTEAEARGLAIFDYEQKGNCSGCHLVNLASNKPEDPLFTDFTYKATDVARKTAIPQNSDPTLFDLGLCGPERTPPTLPTMVAPGVTINNFCGKFRVPSSRNLAERTSFIHNGVFKDLHDVVQFYDGRNIASTSNDLKTKYQSNIERTKAPFNRPVHAELPMSETNISEIVAFLHTLSDGYKAL